MKAIIRKTVVFTLILAGMAFSANAQKVFRGTVYREGKLAAGVTVEAHRGSSMMTGFDGKYEVTTDSKAKWIRFTFIDEQKRVDLTETSPEVIDFSFDGVIPAAEEEEVAGVSLKSANELVAANDLEFMNNLSMYNEFYKQEDFKSALVPWRKLYDNYPKSTLNIYIHGVNMYETFVEKAKTKAEKQMYLDSMMKVYDRRIKFFDQKGFVLGRKGTAWLKYNLPPADDISDEELAAIYKKGYDMFEGSLKEQGNQTELPVLVLLMQTSVSLMKLGHLPKETVVTNYEKISGVVNFRVKEKADEENLAETRVAVENIFGASGAADCEALTNIFTPQFAEKGNDIEFLKDMLRRLSRANCDDSPLFFKASEKMYHLDPSAEAAFNMARMFVKQGDDHKAKEYYKQAMNQEKDQELLENYYYEFAIFIFAKDNNLVEAREYARKALAINPNNCKANMLIGDIYLTASRTFGSDDFEKASVFWLAVDYFTKAKAGEDCMADASQKINTYRNHYPNKETAFFNGIKEGDSYRVGGWINETTRVRF